MELLGQKAKQYEQKYANEQREQFKQNYGGILFHLKSAQFLSGIHILGQN